MGKLPSQCFTGGHHTRESSFAYCEHKLAICMQLEEEREQLLHDIDDMREALSGETDARLAATAELEARLQAKEKAEADKEAAEAQFRELKHNYIAKVEGLAKAQDTANAEACTIHVAQNDDLHACVCATVANA
jgi:hypothetical protein